MGTFRRARLMRWLSFLLVMGCMAPGIHAGSALAVPLLLPNLPDFYQHQKAGAGWNVENDAAITFKSGAPFPGSKLPDGSIAPGKAPSYRLDLPGGRTAAGAA
jgi:hypothetical protein